MAATRWSTPPPHLPGEGERQRAHGSEARGSGRGDRRAAWGGAIRPTAPALAPLPARARRRSPRHDEERGGQAPPRSPPPRAEAAAMRREERAAVESGPSRRDREIGRAHV